MAVLAGSLEPRLDVARVGGRREFFLVTREASRRHRLEFTVSPALVAGVAVDGGVGASQWEPIIMLLHVLDRDLPPSDSVALLAIGAQLALVNIGMAILATLSNVRKNHLHVTPGAGHGSVHAAQGITRLIVVELGDRPDRLPATRAMAVLAGKSQVAVRAVCAFGGLRSCASREYGKRDS